MTAFGFNAAQGQIVADPNADRNQRPTVLQTANGLPQVNIQTPSAAGVSRNTYQQFDVQNKGAILNNSRTAVQTQQGGWVLANPWLAKGSARIILNEVNSSSPSLLNGYVEVAGQSAEVVIANPAGIRVDGGGFINTNQVTLTTGSPLVNGGSLEGYRVQGGSIQILGNGLDLSTSDYSAILARAVQVNAGLWAKELNVVTGANQIEAASLTSKTTPVATPIAGTGPVPSFALDVSHIGGMYASKIWMIGSEAGLGVRTTGTLDASGGDLVLQNNGWLTSEGALQASDHLHITTRGDVTHRGWMNGVETRINADSVNNMGTGRIYGGRVSIAASNLTNDAETVNGVTTSATIAARDRLDLGIGNTLTNREHALIYSVGDISLGGALNANRQATGTSDTVNNLSATIEAGGDFTLASTTLRNTNAHFSSALQPYTAPYARHWTTGDVNHSLTYDTTVVEEETVVTSSDPGKLLAAGSMHLKGGEFINDKSQIIAGKMLSGDLNHLNTIQAMGVHNLRESGTVVERVHGWEGGPFGRGDYYDTYVALYEPATVTTSVTLPVTSVMQRTALADSALGMAAQTPRTIFSASLYKANPMAGGRYLVETDPRFRNQGQWLGSDYMTQALSLDPSVTQKRLGDGLYEQQLIRDQVAELTGRRFLADATRDDQQYMALMDSAITFGQQYNLRPGIALTAQQIAQLTSDIVWLVEQSVTLPDGSVQKVLVPQVYVKVQAGDLDGTGALLAGQDIHLTVSGDLVNSGTLAGRNIVQLTAKNVHNLGGRMSGNQVRVTAAQDLNNLGGSIRAVSELEATAGHDLNVQTTTVQTSHARSSRAGVDRVAGLYVSGANGTLLASAENDVNLVASVIDNSGAGHASSTTLAAGNNLNLSSLTSRDSNNVVWDAQNFRHESSSTEVGSQVGATGKLTLNAGNDLNVRAANVQAAQALDVKAGRNVTLAAGQNTDADDEAHQHTSSGLLSSTTTTTRETYLRTTAQASSLGGKTVAIQAGSDISVQGASVASDAGTALVAGHNIGIEADKDTSRRSSYRQERTSGLMSGDGMGISYGSTTASHDGQSQSTTTTASTVGSVDGNVSITAGEHYTQVGSVVVAAESATRAGIGGDITIQAKQVDIMEARETHAQQQERKFEQSGITLAITSTVASSVQTAQTQLNAASQTSDNRMKTLAAANAAMHVKQAADAVQADLGISVGVGSVRSQEKQQHSADNARGSSITAGGNVNIQATGAGKDSALTVQGSDIQAKEATSLQADGHIHLLAAQNTVTQSSSSQRNSASVGMAIQLGNAGTGVGFASSASKATGLGAGQSVTYSNSHVSGHGVSIDSGTDITLKGSTITGNQVTAQMGGNLNIESLQDTHDYQETSQSISGSMMIGSGGGSSLNMGHAKINSDDKSVTEQSAIRSDDGGFNVHVQGNTTLTGGQITSTQAAVDDHKNAFHTGGALTTTEMQNNARYDATSVVVGLGTGTPSPGAAMSAGLSGVGMGSDDGRASSTTTAGVSGIAGNAQARTGDKATGIAPIFNPDQVKAEINAQATITQEFGKQSTQAVGDYAAIQLNAAQASKDQAGIDAWQEGGSARVALHAVVAGLTGGGPAAAGALTSQTAVPQLGDALRESDIPLGVKQTLILAAGTATGSLTGDAAGAAAGLNATANNYLFLYNGKIIAYDKNDNNHLIELSAKDLQKLAAAETDVLMKDIAGIHSDSAPSLVKDDRARDMTDSTFYDLNNAQDRAQLQAKTDMGYSHLDDQSTRIYIQTGMNTQPQSARQNAQELSHVVKEPVGVIVNTTQGLPKDIAEYLPNAPALKDALNEYTYQELNKKGDTLVVMHSAGNEDAKKALALGQAMGHQYSNLSFLSLGSPVSNKVLRTATTNTQANYLGQVNDWRDPVTHPTVWALGTGALALGGLVGGGLGAGMGGGLLLGGINTYHPLESYIAKPQAQSVMFDWKAKQSQ